MEDAEYRKLQAYEPWYWWYVAQRANLINAVRGLSLPANARLLDAGCGTGYNLTELVGTLPVEAHGVDVSPYAAALWNGNPGVQRCRASVNELPYADGSFHVVVSVDVIGCSGVETVRALFEMARVLQVGGYVVLLVPAYQWMLSEHDAAVHSVVRFTRARLRLLATSAGLRVERLTHRFTLLFPFIAATRLWRKPVGRIRDPDAATRADSDLSPLPSWFNQVLLAVVRAEQRLLGRVDLPVGSTILMVARKESP